MKGANPEQSPLVSVMMPARNAARFLEAAVKSVQAQTHSNWELIFVDDGSKDNTLEIVNRLAAADTRIKVHSIPFGGRGRARNACLDRISGDFVAVCDSDDVSFPDRFVKQLKFLESHPQIGAVGSWWIPFHSESPSRDSPVKKWPTESEDISSAFRRRKMRIHDGTVMLRKQLFERYGRYNVELHRAQGYEVFARMSNHGVKFAALPEPLLYYRQASSIPSLDYYLESSLYKAYADRLLKGTNGGFESFANSWSGRAWRIYFRINYIYFLWAILR